MKKTLLATMTTLLIACGGGVEKQVVDSYFRAVQTKDAQTAAGISTVTFDGGVKSWKIVSVGEEQRSPAPAAELGKAMTTAAEAEAANKKEYSSYFNAHPVEVDKVQKLIASNGAIPAALSKTAEDWKAFIDKEKTLKAAAVEAKIAFEREKKLVSQSTNQKDGVEALVGDVVLKEAVVEVEREGGEMKNYKVTLRRYEVGQPDKPRLGSRWIITGIAAQ